MEKTGQFSSRLARWWTSTEVCGAAKTLAMVIETAFKITYDNGIVGLGFDRLGKN
jgi:hypothetical protein